MFLKLVLILSSNVIVVAYKLVYSNYRDVEKGYDVYINSDSFFIPHSSSSDSSGHSFFPSHLWHPRRQISADDVSIH